jgi:hypothetical protein|tara:strand:- start:43 stop:555 length:513 start_codon:yes stop_codon:yes gene_type:complete
MIKIVDNFFSDEVLEKTQHKVVNGLIYAPLYFDNNAARDKQNYYGSRFFFKDDLSLCKLFWKTTEDKFKIKIKKINPGSGVDIRNLDHFKPHDDVAAGIANVLIMIKGLKSINNGVVFYSDDQLDTHIGFRENRAVMFPSNLIHSPHLTVNPNMRYTASIFIEEYDELIQ